MNKKIRPMLILLLALFSAFSASAAAPAAVEPKSLNFLYSRFIPLKGYVFVFEVTGDFDRNELVGTITIEETTVRKLSCTLNEDAKHVVCTASGLKRFATKPAVVRLAGFYGNTTIPMPVISQEFCYSLYDWATDGSSTWTAFAVYCRNGRALLGDSIDMYNPNWGATYTYIYTDSVPCDDQGNGYYFGVAVDNYYAIFCP